MRSWWARDDLGDRAVDADVAQQLRADLGVAADAAPVGLLERPPRSITRSESTNLPMSCSRPAVWASSWSRLDIPTWRAMSREKAATAAQWRAARESRSSSVRISPREHAPGEVRVLARALARGHHEPRHVGEATMLSRTKTSAVSRARRRSRAIAAQRDVESDRGAHSLQRARRLRRSERRRAARSASARRAKFGAIRTRRRGASSATNSADAPAGRCAWKASAAEQRSAPPTPAMLRQSRASGSARRPSTATWDTAGSRTRARGPRKPTASTAPTNARRP